MPYSAPWTEIGRLQQEMDSVKSDLRGKVDSHEYRTAASGLASLERSMREISSLVASFEYRLQAVEEFIKEAEYKKVVGQ